MATRNELLNALRVLDTVMGEVKDDLSEARIVTINEGGELGYDERGENLAHELSELEDRRAELIEALEKVEGEMDEAGEFTPEMAEESAKYF